MVVIGSRLKSKCPDCGGYLYLEECLKCGPLISEVSGLMTQVRGVKQDHLGMRFYRNFLFLLNTASGKPLTSDALGCDDDDDLGPFNFWERVEVVSQVILNDELIWSRQLRAQFLQALGQLLFVQWDNRTQFCLAEFYYNLSRVGMVNGVVSPIDMKTRKAVNWGISMDNDPLDEALSIIQGHKPEYFNKIA